MTLYDSITADNAQGATDDLLRSWPEEWYDLLEHHLQGGQAVFNVRSPKYGAVGDNVTDDYAAFAAATTAAKAAGRAAILVPPGRYRLGTRWVVDGGNIDILGWGRGSTQIRMQASANLTELLHVGKTDASTTTTDYVTISGIHFHGSKNNNTGTNAVIKLYNARFYQIRDCLVSNSAGNGIWETTANAAPGWLSERGAIIDTDVTACARDYAAVLLDSPKNSIYSRLRIHNNLGSGIHIKPIGSSYEATQCLFSDLSITNNDGIGIIRDGTTRFRFVGGILDFNKGGAVQFRNTLAISSTNDGSWSDIGLRNNGHRADDAGTANTGSDGTTLVDTTGNFLTNGRLPGDVIVNSTQSTVSRVLSVDSETQVTTTDTSPSPHTDGDSYTITRRYPGFSPLQTDDWGSCNISNLEIQHVTSDSQPEDMPADTRHVHLDGGSGTGHHLSNVTISGSAGVPIYAENMDSGGRGLSIRGLRLSSNGDAVSTTAHGLWLAANARHANISDVTVHGDNYNSTTGAYGIYIESIDKDVHLSNLRLWANEAGFEIGGAVGEANWKGLRIRDLNVQEDDDFKRTYTVVGANQTVTLQHDAFVGTINLTAAAGATVDKIIPVMPSGYALAVSFTGGNVTLNHNTGTAPGKIQFTGGAAHVGGSTLPVLLVSDGTNWIGSA